MQIKRLLSQTQKLINKKFHKFKMIKLFIIKLNFLKNTLNYFLTTKKHPRKKLMLKS